MSNNITFDVTALQAGDKFKLVSIYFPAENTWVYTITKIIKDRKLVEVQEAHVNALPSKPLIVKMWDFTNVQTLLKCNATGELYSALFNVEFHSSKPYVVTYDCRDVGNASLTTIQEMIYDHTKQIKVLDKDTLDSVIARYKHLTYGKTPKLLS